MRGAFFPLAHMQNKWSKLLCFSFQSCVTFWLWGTLAPGTASDLSAIWNRDEFPGYRTAPTGATLFFFWPRFCSNQKECQWEAPSALTPPPPHLTFTCAIGQKRASVPPRAPRGPILWCTACLMGSNTPLQSCTPAPHTTTSITPHPGQIKPSHSLQWVNEWVNANKQMNTLQQLSLTLA